MSRPKLQPVSGDFVVFRYRNRHTVCLVGGGARNPVALHAIVTYCVQTTFQAFALASAQVLVPGANFCHHCGWKKGAVKATVVRTEAPFAKSLRHDYCWSRAAESWLTVSTCGPSLSMLQCTTSCRECAPHAGLKAIAEHAACSLTETLEAVQDKQSWMAESICRCRRPKLRSCLARCRQQSRRLQAPNETASQSGCACDQTPSTLSFLLRACSVRRVDTVWVFQRRLRPPHPSKPCSCRVPQQSRQGPCRRVEVFRRQEAYT